MEVYVNARSKKAINEALATGQEVLARAYLPTSVDVVILNGAPDGTIVKVHRNEEGDPMAHAYGVMRGGVLK